MKQMHLSRRFSVAAHNRQLCHTRKAPWGSLPCNYWIFNCVISVDEFEITDDRKSNQQHKSWKEKVKWFWSCVTTGLRCTLQTEVAVAVTPFGTMTLTEAFYPPAEAQWVWHSIVSWKANKWKELGLFPLVHLVILRHLPAMSPVWWVLTFFWY